MYRIAVALSDSARMASVLSYLEPRVAAGEFTVVCAEPTAEFIGHVDEVGRIDILLVDTVLDACDEGTGGIDFVERRYPEGSSTQIIYVTGHYEHATAAYRTKHVYLLGDRAVREDYDAALQAACSALRAAANRPVGVRVDGKVRLVFPQHITYIESDRRKLHIHMGDEVLTTYLTLDAMARALPETFVRCHKSFLVSIRCIESIGSSRLTLFGGEVLPVSQKRRKATYDAFIAYMGSCL